MLVWLKAGKHRGNPALGIDYKRRAVDAHILLAVHALFLEHAVLDRDSLVFIRQQRIREILFLLEFLLGGGLVGGNTQHHSASLLDLSKCVAEPARFNRSTRRVSFRIKKENHVLAAIVF